ncbi:hypothetical protein GZH53_15800 [Flavihumibacter sp. R14]|nr:hypothetical protein [Flavihumibacter soli]
MRSLLSLLFIIITGTAHAQLLSLAELISFTKKDASSINEELIAKNWKFISSSPASDDELEKLTWALSFSEFDSTAIAWLHIRRQKNGPNRVAFQFHDNKDYMSLIKVVKALPAKKELSNAINNTFYTTYSSKNYTYLFNVDSDTFTLKVYEYADFTNWIFGH